MAKLELDHWKQVMVDGCVMAKIKGVIGEVENMKLCYSVVKPIPEVIEPDDAFTSYLFEKANAEAEKELKGM